MSYKRKRWTSDLIRRRIAEGRGQGEGAYYTPWHLVQDFPSAGRVHRIRGLKADRIHHLFSDLEANAFFIFDLAQLILDIREQFPLFDIEETLEIAHKAGIKHPANPYTKHPVVMTTDFLLTIKCGMKIVHHARTLKYANEINNSRVMEKFEIERRYWEARNINWGYITENDIPFQLVENARFLHPYFSFTSLYPLTKKQVRRVIYELTERIHVDPRPLCEVASACDQKFGLSPGKSLAVARHLLARKIWKVDMNQPIRLSQRLTLIESEIKESF
jgi:hypothetical protein